MGTWSLASIVSPLSSEWVLVKTPNLACVLLFELHTGLSISIPDPCYENPQQTFETGHRPHPSPPHLAKPGAWLVPEAAVTRRHCMKQDLVPAEKLAFTCGGGRNLRSQYFYLKIKIKRPSIWGKSTHSYRQQWTQGSWIHKLSFLVWRSHFG